MIEPALSANKMTQPGKLARQGQLVEPAEPRQGLVDAGEPEAVPGERMVARCDRLADLRLDGAGDVGEPQAGAGDENAVDAVFGGEHSAHYYFAGNYRADSGLIASVLLLAELSRAEEQLSVLRKPFERYASSGEINTQVDDPLAVIERVSDEFGDFDQDRLDGLSVDCGRFWFNLRPSNTEPLLLLNLEAVDRNECDDRVADLLSLITQA